MRPTVFTSLLVFAMALEAFCPTQLNAEETLRDATYARLGRVRETKKKQLTAYLERIRTLAESVPKDPVMRKYFLIKKQFHELERETPPPKDAAEAIETLIAGMREHYLREYHSFYDILFVDASGYVFSTIRHQNDYGQNLFKGKLAKTALSQRLRTAPDQAFVDYEFYAVSDEPSAFLVQPMTENGERQGWFVLQCALNKINMIFTRGANLGKTGEVFLVNRNHQMLTDSRLKPDASGLRQHLSRTNIESKFAERKGHKLVTDYRGYPALTSFEVCPVLGTEWLLIAKIDEDEVITDYYQAHREKLAGRLAAALSNGTPPFCKPRILPKDSTLVDIDEFRNAEDKTKPLVTFGVSTCTALTVALPGELAYLGHASAYDRIYGDGDMDLAGHMLKRIRQFEVYPYQVRSLNIALVAPHCKSVTGAIDRLVEEGILLSQIRFLHNPEAASAAVMLDIDSGHTLARWMPTDTDASPRWQSSAETPPVSEIVKGLIGYAEE